MWWCIRTVSCSSLVRDREQITARAKVPERLLGMLPEASGTILGDELVTTSDGWKSGVSIK